MTAPNAPSVQEQCEMLVHRFDDEPPPAEYLLTGLPGSTGMRGHARKACNACVVRVRAKVAAQRGKWAGLSVEARSLPR